MPTLNVTDRELGYLDTLIDLDREADSPNRSFSRMRADLHDKIRDLRGHPRKGRREDEKRGA